MGSIVHGVACPPLFMLEKIVTVQGKLNLSQLPNVVFKMLPCISPSSHNSSDITPNCRHSDENNSVCSASSFTCKLLNSIFVPIEFS